MCDKPKVTLSELILAAVCHLQEKNGVTACEIAEFIANKRGCELDQIKSMITMVLCKAKSNGILCEKRGLFRIKSEFDDPQPQQGKEKDKEPVTLSEESEEEEEEDDDDDEGEEEDKSPIDPCRCLQLSRECLSEEEENRCGQDDKCPKKKRKCK